MKKKRMSRLAITVFKSDVSHVSRYLDWSF